MSENFLKLENYFYKLEYRNYMKNLQNSLLNGYVYERFYFLIQLVAHYIRYLNCTFIEKISKLFIPTFFTEGIILCIKYFVIFSVKL